jgi:hypothetical protein
LLKIYLEVLMIELVISFITVVALAIFDTIRLVSMIFIIPAVALFVVSVCLAYHVTDLTAPATSEKIARFMGRINAKARSIVEDSGHE